jgi:hypothetical protein
MLELHPKHAEYDKRRAHFTRDARTACCHVHHACVGGFACRSPGVRRCGGARNCVVMSGESNVELLTDNVHESSSMLLQYDSNIRTSYPPVSDSSSDDGCV